MDCHACAAIGLARSAVSLCRSCSVGLRKDHLVEAILSSAPEETP